MICASCGQTGVDPNTFYCPNCSQTPLLNRQYELLEVLSRSDSETTFLAKQSYSSDKLLIRQVDQLGAITYDDRDWFRRLSQELRMASHANLVRYTAEFVLETDSGASFCLVRDFVEGKSLEEVSPEKAFSETEVLAIAKQVLEGLEYLHSRTPPVSHGLPHPRYLIQRSKDTQVVLLDIEVVHRMLELPRVRDYGASGATSIFHQNEMEPTNDLRALALTMLSLLNQVTPELPWDFSLASRTFETANASPPFLTIVERALLKTAKRRFQTAGEMKRAVQEALMSKEQQASSSVGSQTTPTSSRPLLKLESSVSASLLGFDTEPTTTPPTQPSQPQPSCDRPGHSISEPKRPSTPAHRSPSHAASTPGRTGQRRPSTPPPKPAPGRNVGRSILFAVLPLIIFGIAAVVAAFVFFSTRMEQNGAGVEESPVVTNPGGRSGHVCDDGASCEANECDVSELPNAPEHGICQALGYQQALHVVWGDGDGENDETMPHAYNWQCHNFVCGPSHDSRTTDNCSSNEMLHTITCQPFPDSATSSSEAAEPPPTEIAEVMRLAGSALEPLVTHNSPYVKNPYRVIGHVCDDGATCPASECDVFDIPNAPEHGICQALGHSRAVSVQWGYGQGENDVAMPHAYNWQCANYRCGPGSNPHSTDNCSVTEMLRSITCSDASAP